MRSGSLEEAIQRAGGAVALLRNWPARAHTLPIIAEHTNWQSEQRAWRESCALMDQSHHMTDLFLRGEDALRLLRDLGVNSFEHFGPGRAKQFIVCNPDGFYIGDVIAFHLSRRHVRPRRARDRHGLGAVPPRDGQLRGDVRT
jgi:glycine cleavage system aminomethyltransferase T